MTDNRMSPERLAEIGARAEESQRLFATVDKVAMFAVKYREDIPMLLDEVERLREENEALRNGGHFTALEMAKITMGLQERDNLRAENERLRDHIGEVAAASNDYHDLMIDAERENTRLRAELEGLRATYEAAGMIIGYWERLYAAEHTKVKRLESELEAAKARWEETASDGTGYTLSHLDGIFSVSDPQGYVVCEFLRGATENGGAQE